REPSEHFIVIAGEIIYCCAIAHHLNDALNHFHVAVWPVSFAELPDINDIAVQNKNFWIDRFQVLIQLFGMTTISAEMYIRNYRDIQFFLCHISSKIPAGLLPCL